MQKPTNPARQFCSEPSRFIPVAVLRVLVGLVCVVWAIYLSWRGIDNSMSFLICGSILAGYPINQKINLESVGKLLKLAYLFKNK